jgi:hypothetical protein
MYRKLKAALFLSITLLLAFVLIARPSLLSLAYNNAVIEVNPLISIDQSISDGALFRVYSIISPVSGGNETLFIDVNNNYGNQICVSKVMVSGETVMNESQCFDNGVQGRLNVLFKPTIEGGYPVRVYYSSNGEAREPLDFMINLRPVNQSNALRTVLMVDGHEVTDEVTVTSNSEITAGITISSNRLGYVNATRGVM